jgi:hypothetical protein
VALAIFSLILGVLFTCLGPWFSETRRAEREAAFWRSLPAANTVLSEFAAGGVNLTDTLRVSSNEVAFQTYVPRYAAQPAIAHFSIRQSNSRYRLSVQIGDQTSTLLSGAPPMRFRASENRHSPYFLSIEMLRGRAWMPISVAHFSANGPLNCVFDIITRECR